MIADKTLNIKDASDKQLRILIRRLSEESEAQELIRRLRDNSKDRDPRVEYGELAEYVKGVDLNTPIKDLYHYGVKGMKWGTITSDRPTGRKKRVGNNSATITKRASSTTSNANAGGSENSIEAERARASLHHLKKSVVNGTPTWTDQETKKQYKGSLDDAIKEKHGLRGMTLNGTFGYQDKNGNFYPGEDLDQVVHDKIMAERTLASDLKDAISDKLDELADKAGEAKDKAINSIKSLLYDLSHEDEGDYLKFIADHSQTLYHFGIKGQKWGVRRGRNVAKRHGSETKTEGISELSDQELSRRINRIRLESDYARLTAPQKSAGRKYVEDLLKESGKAVAKDFVTSVMKTAVKGPKDKALAKIAKDLQKKK